MDKKLPCILHFWLHLYCAYQKLVKRNEWTIASSSRSTMFQLPTKNSTSLQNLLQNLQKDYVHLASFFWDLQSDSSVSLSHSPEALLVEGNQEITLVFTGFTMSFNQIHNESQVSKYRHTSMIPTKYICSPRMKVSASAYYYWLATPL